MELGVRVAVKKLRLGVDEIHWHQQEFNEKKKEYRLPNISNEQMVQLFSKESNERTLFVLAPSTTKNQNRCPQYSLFQAALPPWPLIGTKQLRFLTPVI